MFFVSATTRPPAATTINEELGDGTVHADRGARAARPVLEARAAVGPRRARTARHLRLSGRPFAGDAAARSDLRPPGRYGD